MTDLLIQYLKHRAQGHGHHAALKALARRFDMDKTTVDRVIERAQRAEHQAKFPPPLPDPSMSFVPPVMGAQAPVASVPTQRTQEGRVANYARSAPGHKGGAPTFQSCPGRTPRPSAAREVRLELSDSRAGGAT